jgi:hypothetical protein
MRPGRRSTATRAKVGPSLPEKMGVPKILVTFFFVLRAVGRGGDGRVRVRRNVGHGWEVLNAPAGLADPVLDTANEDAAERAGASVMRYKRARPGRGAKKVAAEMPKTRTDAQREAEHADHRNSHDAVLLMEHWIMDQTVEADFDWCGLTARGPRSSSCSRSSDEGRL